MDFLRAFFDLLFHSTKYIILAIEAGLIVVFVMTLILKQWQQRRTLRANLVLAVVALGFVLVVAVAEIGLRWQLVVGLLPAILITYQALYLWVNQPKEIQSNGASRWEREELEHSRRLAANTISKHFSVRSLSIKYVFPAVLLAICGIVILNVVVDPKPFTNLVTGSVSDPKNITKMLLGIKLGAIGAYTYILMELGRRTFRHDITGASAMWCMVTLVLGPILAAAVAILWRLEGPQDSSWWGAGVVLFFTGFAPRRVMAAIEQAAVQLLRVGGTGVVVQTRLIPLSRIRGISTQIEERLSEEGIIDVNSLAEAEPIRLVRNTSFDMRQILSWIDEAILIDTLPKGWEALEEEGITGAIDLAWYWQGLNRGTDEAKQDELRKHIGELAQKANVPPASLFAAIQRLSEDTQVRYIWALYNSFSDFAPDGGAPDLSPTGVTAS
jgi:hypothetical protein